MAAPWSPHHLRLHRQLLADPLLLPRGEGLLLAVSGGQDSIALTALLQDLRRLHGWRLWLWHGDHRWRAESDRQASELAAWAETRQLPLSIDTWQQPIAAEAAAREWRYRCLAAAALRLGASHVVTGHTASDRAETALLNLARGSHRRGLASLGARRPLGRSDLLLVRPMLVFTRDETAAICRALELPVWQDPSNADPRFSRNRIRREVMPVLQALHPGAERRISALAERLAAEEQGQSELLELALLPLRRPAPNRSAAPAGGGLDRRGLLRLQRANQGLLLQHWLRQATQRPLSARQLEALLARLPSLTGSCRQQLAGGWQLRWRHSTLWVQHDTSPICDDPIA
ncbi:MAG: tRNA lysidine(34) synthetase TilS [Synechococcaceae cyanobacterium]|nr:tRNA lysidine(34) synthetase TilS [Synechococcaceae cyanobacterium]